MSEVRHYQNIESGRVYTVGSLGPVSGDRIRENAVEVQVAPLDAIVIRREDLPEVKVDEDGDVGVGGYWRSRDTDPGHVEASARALLAIARYLREHPPVDPEVERQVKALTDALEAAQPAHDLVAMARLLVENGVRVEAQP
jgi:hypothetical protein